MTGTVCGEVRNVQRPHRRQGEAGSDIVNSFATLPVHPGASERTPRKTLTCRADASGADGSSNASPKTASPFINGAVLDGDARHAMPIARPS